MSDEEDYDSEEDLDYVPEAEDVSEEENSGDEEDLSVLESGEVTGSRRKKQKTKNGLNVRQRKGGIKLDDEESNENDRVNDEEKNKLAEEIAKEKEEKKKLAEEIAKEKEDKKKELEKKRADDLWSSFMSDVKVPPKKAPVTSSVALGPAVKNENISNNSSSSQEKKEEATPKTVTITKVFDFAGEEVKVTKEIATDSKEAQKELKKQEEMKKKETEPSCVDKPAGSVLGNIGVKRPAGAGSGLGGVLNKIGKKQKMSVLDKSKMDWNSFKKEEGIEEDLKIHNNSKEGYIERMKFLQRSDLRQFEIEKNMRLSNRSKR